ncbi:MAG: hypothetical protein RLY71_462 [Pseudomonadota bacterium]|jgi:hypothetical protein
MSARRHRKPRHQAAAQPHRPLRVRAWWVMRESAVFSLQDLLFTVADGSERCAAHNLRAYIRALEEVAVLVQVRAHGLQHLAQQPAWRLARDLGPIAPVARRQPHHQVWDGNRRAPVLPIQSPAQTTAQSPAQPAPQPAHQPAPHTATTQQEPHA